MHRVKNLSRQSGFVPVLILLAITIMAVVGLVVWPKITGVTPTPTPPPNCRYEEVVCVKAPCPPVLICDDERDTIDETANWKQIVKRNWDFKIPINWNYLECNSTEDLIFIGPDIKKDETIDCAFDVGPGIIQISRTNNTAEIKTLPNSPSEDLKISEKKTIRVGDKEGIIQREEQTEGQGEGTYYVVYIIHSPYKTDIITLKDITEKETLDKILSTFRFN